MPNATYANWLSPDERLAAIRQGYLVKCAESGVTKAAVSVLGTLDSATKAVLVGSVLTGIPMGVMAYAINRRLSRKRQQERELQERIEFYNEAAHDLESGLAERGATV